MATAGSFRNAVTERREPGRYRSQSFPWPTNRYWRAPVRYAIVLFVGGFDEEASPLSAKGFGELTAVLVAPAIANAVDHEIGKRVRDLPIAMEKVL